MHAEGGEVFRIDLKARGMRAWVGDDLSVTGGFGGV